MASQASEFSTKELTRATWRDFERLFDSRPAPGAFMCSCMFHHRPKPPARRELPESRAERAAKNRREKRKLVEDGRAHGILVYAHEEPVGWCQYGLREELPRFDNRLSYPKLGLEDDPKKLWRITCFLVPSKYRGRGVAGVALKAALEAIGRKGGGFVEAYPSTRWGSDTQSRGAVSMFRREGFDHVAPLGANGAVMRKRI